MKQIESCYAAISNWCVLAALLLPSALFAESLTVSPISNINIQVPLAVKSTKVIPYSEHFCIEEASSGYLILYTDSFGNRAPAILPYRDRMGNPTANSDFPNIVIRSMANVEVQPGYLPFLTNSSYSVVDSSNNSYLVAYTVRDFSQTVWIAKSTLRLSSTVKKTAGDNPVLLAQTNSSLRASLVTLNGTTYQNVKITSVDPDGLNINHSRGVAKVFFWELPEDIQKKHHYDPIKAKAYHAQVLAATRERARQEAEMAQQQQTYNQQMAEIKQAQSEREGMITNRTVFLGMTKAEALRAWGQPDDINRTANEYGVSEQWVYGDKYIYFDNDVLTAWQD